MQVTSTEQSTPDHKEWVVYLSAWAFASEDHRLGDFNNRNLMHTVLKHMVQVFACSLLVSTSSWEEDVYFHTYVHVPSSWLVTGKTKRMRGALYTGKRRGA